MKQRPTGRPSSSEKIIRDIKRKTRKLPYTHRATISDNLNTVLSTKD